jgi:hypothetical protein
MAGHITAHKNHNLLWVYKSAIVLALKSDLLDISRSFWRKCETDLRMGRSQFLREIPLLWAPIKN